MDTFAICELDHKRQRTEAQERKIIADIKAMAKKNQMDSVKVMAKDGAIDDAGNDEETDQMANRVLDKLGIQMGEEMARIPSEARGLNIGGEKVGRQAVAAGGGGGGSSGGNEMDDDLQARLDQLRRE